MSLFKSILIITFGFLIFTVNSSAQENFDIVTFTPPKNWQKEIKRTSVQFYKQEGENDTFALIRLFKVFPTRDKDSKTNFNIWWESLIKTDFKADAPQMQPVMIKNGWTIETGTAQIERNGQTATATLIAALGSEQFVNLVVVTDTGKFKEEISAFVESIVLPEIKAPKSVSVQTKPTRRRPPR